MGMSSDSTIRQYQSVGVPFGVSSEVINSLHAHVFVDVWVVKVGGNPMGDCVGQLAKWFQYFAGTNMNDARSVLRRMNNSENGQDD